MSTQRLPIALTMGDPAGCGPQITQAAWQGRERHQLPAFYVLGSPDIYCESPTIRIEHPADAIDVFDKALPVLPVSDDGVSEVQIGHPDPAYAAEIIESIRLATEHTLSGQSAAIVTNPISKAVLYEAGFSHPGHTEFIAGICSAADSQTYKPVMMLIGGGLRVALATIHVPLMQVLQHLTASHLSEVARLTHRALIRDFGVSSPRIAFTGLNPHAGEGGSIGTEEQELINPVAARLRSEGLSIANARPADTIFHEALSGRYDAVIAMTHDQGLIPVKTLDMWGGVNTTLGLPIIRTSPDHGTAYEAAAASTCRPDSLIAALKQAKLMVQSREISDG
ncbi:MAG: 4-hydroxythreonine-4-phosphate dehydrogenase PdxA [Pseudomonadota bacterium]